MIGYQLAAVENRKQITSTLAAIPSSGLLNYDANDRTLTDQYDANGNTISQAGIADAYDFENHLTQHGYITYVYDGDGNRVAKTIGGVTTSYLVDTLNPTGYAQVLDEVQNTGVARSYAWGLQLVSETQLVAATPPASPWQTSWYGFDGHGSVRYLTDASGAVTDAYTYDAFGNLINSTGSTPNLYLFAGEQYDPDLGLYYNRARYLDVRVGRFWGMDTEEGDEEDPLSLHKYIYVEGDPVDGLDPSGDDDISSVMGMSETLDSMATIQMSATIKAATSILPYPATQQARQLVGVVYAESSSPGRGGGENADEKLAIAQTFVYEAYIGMTYPKKWNTNQYGTGELWTAISRNSDAVISNRREWQQVMDGKSPTCDLRKNLNDPLVGQDRTHLNNSIIAVMTVPISITSPSQLTPLKELGNQPSISFKANGSPNPNKHRQKQIGKIQGTTFWGFLENREAQ